MSVFSELSVGVGGQHFPVGIYADAPVSYTHLDVYKRQPLGHDRAGLLDKAARMLHVPAGELEPVSYTHLDVYKRQVQADSQGYGSADAYGNQHTEHSDPEYAGNPG